jgi:hypothetical protein
MSKIYLAIGILIVILLFALIVSLNVKEDYRFPRGETIGGEVKCLGGECPLHPEPLPANFSYGSNNETH